MCCVCMCVCVCVLWAQCSGHGMTRMVVCVLCVYVCMHVWGGWGRGICVVIKSKLLILMEGFSGMAAL